MTQTIDENLKSEIIDSLDLKDLTSLEQEAIISDLEEKIIDQVNSIVLDRLDDGEKEELEALLDEGEIADFLKKTIPDLEEVKKEAAIWVVKNWRERIPQEI